ncbi:MAG: phosphate transport system regulatory protein PhoU [Deltaproteobacteria bacterium]|nr:MAG: phosphate transport system regulatory protein PhoU [Deltaproteobacteria bacterium]
MERHLERELDKLRKKILALGTMVEGSIDKAILSLMRHDLKLAKEVIENDHEIDHLEVEIEEEGLKILALYQPAAIDLRYVVGILKMNNDLERMGDLAVNIAERAAYLANQREMGLFLDFANMSKKTRAMVRKALDALIKMDPQMAKEVCAADDDVDEINKEILNLIQDHIENNPQEVKPLIHLLLASRHLERIADLATNIAEDVVYMTEGEIIRHRTEDYTRQD